ncbi:MAG TPA: sterol desaturase family protein [Burkholderiales bacterium]|nr:sterol desaturase family protein [Burkholderiales bacterium]
MLELVVEYESTVRFGLFLAGFAALATWEWAAPRRTLLLPRARRWFANLALAAISVFSVRVIAPAAAVGIAVLAEQRGTGLMHAAEWWQPLEILLAVIALDLAIYLQHVMFHAVPLLWRLHRVHHADLDFDVTTGTRFHPIEILLSLAIKAGVILALGASVAAVLIFEIALNLASMFNHANIRIPKGVDAVLRTLVVTPDMHRVHHSVYRDETDRNFGFCLPWWDHVFGTYRGEPRNGHEQMLIGVPFFRDARRCDTLGSMLFMPFFRDQKRDTPNGGQRRPAKQASA